MWGRWGYGFAAYGAGVFRFQPPPRIVITGSANIAAGGEATTLAGTGSGFTPPSGKTTSDWINGRRWDDENGLDSVTLNAQYTVVGWAIRALSSGVQDGEQYEFRVLNGSTPLDTYSVTPRWTIGQPPQPPVAATDFSVLQALAKPPAPAWRDSSTLALFAPIVPQGAEVTVSLGAVEGPDVLAASVGLRQSVSLAAVEGADTCSANIGLRQSLALTAVEGADTLSGSIGLRQSISLSAVEGADTFSGTIQVGDVVGVALNAVEGSDSFSGAIGLRQSIGLGAVEGADTFSGNVGLRQSISVAAPEAPDSFTGSLGLRQRITLATVEAPDAFSGTLQVGAVQIGVTAKEGSDFALFTTFVVPLPTEGPVTRRRIVRKPQPLEREQEPLPPEEVVQRAPELVDVEALVVAVRRELAALALPLPSYTVPDRIAAESRESAEDEEDEELLLLLNL